MMPIKQEPNFQGGEKYKSFQTENDKYDPNKIFKLGEKVEVNYGGRGKWFTGEISKIHPGVALYDIDYDDFSFESRVSSEIIRPSQQSAVTPTRKMDVDVDSQYSDNGDAQFARMDASYLEETPQFQNTKNHSYNTTSVTSHLQQKVNRFNVIDQDVETDYGHETIEEKDERLLQEAIRQIEEEDRRAISKSTSSNSNNANRNATTSSSSSGSHSSSSRPLRTPLYAEDMRVQVSRNYLWSVGRIIRGGVRLDGTYDVEMEALSGGNGETEMRRRVPENDIRPYVPLTDVDSDDERMTVQSSSNKGGKTSDSSNKRASSGPSGGENKKSRPNEGAVSLGPVEKAAQPDKVLTELVAKRDKFELHWQYECLLEEITRADDTKLGELLEQKERFNFNKKIRGSNTIATFDDLYSLCVVLQQKVHAKLAQHEEAYRTDSEVFDMLGRCQQISFKIKKLVEEVNVKRPCPKISNSSDSGSGGDPMNTIPPSAAKADWDYIKMEAKRTANQRAGNKAATTLTTDVKSMDSLMGMTGLESVKRSFLDQYNRLNIAKMQGMEYGASNYNTRFDGNPGTGKTTVARLYAQFLTEVGVLPEDSIVEETTGSALTHGGITELEGILEAVKEAGGGVIFVDEAYQLDDQRGRKILDFILVHAERLKGDYGALVWIFAGYNKKMDKLFEYNIGLPSRFPQKFNFEDYTDAELLKIWNGLLERGGNDVVGDKKKKPEKKTPPAAAPAVPMAPNPYANMYGGFNAYNKPDQTDEWGNVWKWNLTSSTYEDSFNNITGYGVGGLGTPKNPLISRTDNKPWLYDRKKKHWYHQNNMTETRVTYPGKPEPVVVAPVIVSKVTPFILDDKKWSRVAIRRMGRGRGRDGFGNARAVRNLFDLTLKRQSARLTQQMREGKGGRENLHVFLRDDLLGPMASENSFHECAAWAELQAMEGLAEVKEAVRQLLTLVVQNSIRENDEKPLLQVALNRIFLGNPGTGKTTVAKLYARILSDFGLLSKGEVIIKNPSDFKGSALGNSEAQTRAILEQAMGSVLVIDEAYGLSPSNGVGSTKDPYSEAVIQTIVEQVQGVPGEDRAVVMLGYRNEMEKMMANANPGLARRFQLDNAFQFADYDDEALKRILVGRVKGDRIGITEEVAVVAIKQLAKAKALPNFGNAGAVNNLLSEAKLRMQNRQKALPVAQRTDELIEDDFIRPEISQSEDEMFAQLVGCENVRNNLQRIQDTIKFCQLNEMDPNEMCSYNYVFTGAPGTGKTTVARLMGKIFRTLGLIPCDDVIEISASDLITGYVGQAGQKTREMLTKARGKVLFIDEAYQLNPENGGGYMQEVVDEIVKGLTSEEFKGKMIVILAGYEQPMDDMLSVNPGLRSRFSERIHFDDFSVDLVCKLLQKKLQDKKMVIRTEVSDYIRRDIAPALREMPDFGNGRDVDNYYKKVFSAVAVRSMRSVGAVLTVERDDLEKGMAELMKTKSSSSKKPPVATINTNNTDAVPPVVPKPKPQFAKATGAAPPKMATTITTTTATAPPEEEEDEEVEIVEKSAAVAASGGFGSNDNLQFLTALQNMLRAKGLENEQGVDELAGMAMSDPRMGEYIREIMRQLGVTREGAVDLLLDWQTKQSDVKDLLRKEKQKQDQARALNKKVLVPIWRCAVCGAADMPWIVCPVAPFIVMYREM